MNFNLFDNALMRKFNLTSSDLCTEFTGEIYWTSRRKQR